MLSGAADSGVFSTGPTSVMKGYGVHTFAGASCPRRLSAYPSHAQRGRVARRASGETGGGPLRQRTPPVRLASPIGHPPNEERSAQNGRRLSLPRAAGEGGSPRKRRDGWGPSPATHSTRPLGFANRPPSPLKRGGIGARLPLTNRLRYRCVNAVALRERFIRPHLSWAVWLTNSRKGEST